MISVLELNKSLFGAYRLARLDPGGVVFFDTSIEGFWKSFFAAILVAPLFFALLAFKSNNISIEINMLRYFAIEGTAYIIGWFWFPLMIYSLTQTLNLGKNYLQFIVSYNWCSVIQNTVYLPFAILFELNIVSGTTAQIFNLILLSMIVTYIWFIAKVTLDTTTLVAGGIVVLDICLWLALSFVTQSLLVI